MRADPGHRPSGCYRIFCCLIVALTTIVGTGHDAMVAQAIAAPDVQQVASAPIVCDGPNDLTVERGRVTLMGPQHPFDRVCVRHGGILTAAGAMVLRTGILYVAADGEIVTDGQDGYFHGAHDCIGNDVQVDGASARDLTIMSRQALIQGRISANGGAGLDYSNDCFSETPAGRGGDGGAVVIESQDLMLSGSVSATGGNGGAAGNTSNDSGNTGNVTNDSGGNGGKGGTVMLTVAHPDPAALRSHLAVGAGAGGTAGVGPAGVVGAPGMVRIHALTSAEQQALPPAPAPLVAVTGMPPALQPLDAGFAAAHAMDCGAGDLRVTAGRRVQLAGVRRFNHVCIYSGGTLLPARDDLTLAAQTILVEPGGRIDADGVRAPADPASSDATTGDATTNEGGCAPGRATPYGGAPRASESAMDPYAPPVTLTANGGSGGGQFTLIARSMLIAGSLSANGGAGQDGVYALQQWYELTPTVLIGADGGSGGGIRLVASALQLSGQVSVAGGAGGRGAGGVEQAGQHGGPGCIKIFAGTLQSPEVPQSLTSTLPLTGPAVLGHTLPSDPVPPSTGPATAYSANIGHNLGGAFLRFYRRYGGLDTFGYPQTEPFSEGGRLVQYTDRFQLEIADGRVSTALLGQLLTAARTFPRVAPFPAMPARVYVAATGHSLSGRFLAYWRGHNEVLLLGAPISEPVVEGNGDGSGRRYLLQWFERGRLEYHPEHTGTRYVVQLGLLGDQALRQRGWL